MFADLRRLETFRLVAELGSVSAAADRLGYTQSAASQHLAAVEREAGISLIDRSRRPFRPTPAGEALLPHVRRAIADLAAAGAELDDLRGLRAGRLRLATFGSALATFAPTAIRSFRRAHPAVLVQLLERQPPEAVKAIRGGDADLAIVFDVQPASDIVVRDLLVDDLVVALPSRHRLAQREAVAPADLAREPLLMPHRDTPAGRHRQLVQRLLSKAGVEPTIAYETDDLQAAQALTAAGLAIVVLHRLTVDPPRPGVAVRPLTEQDGARRIALAWPAVRVNPAAEVLADRLVAAVRERRY